MLLTSVQEQQENKIRLRNGDSYPDERTQFCLHCSLQEKSYYMKKKPDFH